MSYDAAGDDSNGGIWEVVEDGKHSGAMIKSPHESMMDDDDFMPPLSCINIILFGSEWKRILTSSSIDEYDETCIVTSEDWCIEMLASPQRPPLIKRLLLVTAILQVYANQSVHHMGHGDPFIGEQCSPHRN